MCCPPRNLQILLEGLEEFQESGGAGTTYTLKEENQVGFSGCKLPAERCPQFPSFGREQARGSGITGSRLGRRYIEPSAVFAQREEM